MAEDQTTIMIKTELAGGGRGYRWRLEDEHGAVQSLGAACLEETEAEARADAERVVRGAVAYLEKEKR